MIEVTCNKCGAKTEFSAGVDVYLGCHQCGGQEVVFDRDVTRVCSVCGGKEKIKAVKPVFAFHRKKKNTPIHTICRYKESLKIRKPIRKKTTKKSAAKK